MTTADNPDPVLKVQLSSRRGSAVPSAMTEDDLTREEKVPLNIEISWLFRQLFWSELYAASVFDSHNNVFINNICPTSVNYAV